MKREAAGNKKMCGMSERWEGIGGETPFSASPREGIHPHGYFL